MNRSWLLLEVFGGFLVVYVDFVGCFVRIFFCLMFISTVFTAQIHLDQAPKFLKQDCFANLLSIAVGNGLLISTPAYKGFKAYRFDCKQYTRDTYLLIVKDRWQVSFVKLASQFQLSFGRISTSFEQMSKMRSVFLKCSSKSQSAVLSCSAQGC